MSQIDPHFIEKIEAIGLSPKEAAVYAAVLELCGGYPSKIAEVASLKRSTTYTILEHLAVQGLVTEVERKNKLYYEPASSKRLEQFGNMKIQLAKERAAKIQKILPDIEGLLSKEGERPRVRYFDGVDGIRHVYEDHILVDEPYHMVGWSNTAKLQDFFSASFMNTYVKKKQTLGITSQGIFPDTPAERSYINDVYLDIKKAMRPVLRYIPKDIFPYESEITVYAKNKVSFVSFKNGLWVGVIIEDQTIHDMMRMIFELSWQSANE